MITMINDNNHNNHKENRIIREQNNKRKMILMIKTTEKKKRVTNLNTITCIVQETPHSPVQFLAHQTISNVCVVITDIECAL